MKHVCCSVISLLILQFSYAQNMTSTGIPILTDSLGKINDYLQPIREKINRTSEELNRETLKLVEEWKNAVPQPSIQFEKLVVNFNKKYARITNSNTAEYIDSLSIRLDYIDRKMLLGELVYTFDIRTALSKLANDFDKAACIRNYIRERKHVLNNSCKRKLENLEKQLERYDVIVLKIKEQFRIPLEIETVYNDILERDVQYQSFMRENVLLGNRYGIFTRIN